MALLILQNARHHLPRVQVDIVLKKMIETVIAGDFEFRADAELGASLLCALDRFDNTGRVALPVKGPLIEAASAGCAVLLATRAETEWDCGDLRDSGEMTHDEDRTKVAKINKRQRMFIYGR